MKKSICLLLVAVMVLSLCACGSSEKKEKKLEGLHIGYAREEIMPKTSVPLGGYGQSDQRMSTATLHKLYGTCIAVTDGDETVLIYSQDLIKSDPRWVSELRGKVNEATGVPKENIMICSTHTHSGPDQAGGVGNYKTIYLDAMTKAAKDALADRAPTTVYSADTEVEGMNFIRHYLMNDGSYFGSNFGSAASGYKTHAAENDPQMRLVKFDREGDKKDILVMNWGAHPCFTGGTTETFISSDYIGPTRDKVEADTGMHFAFFLAAAGNHNTNSLIGAEKHDLNVQTYGEKLAQHAIDALPNLQKVEGDGVAITHADFAFAVNHDDAHLAGHAGEVVNVWKAEGRDAGNKVARQYGFSSVYHASAIISRGGRPATSTMELHAIRIGGIGFVTAPYEMWAASGVYIKENSPFPMTVVATCANNSHGYYPTMDAYAYGCYESHTSYFASGVAEATAEQFVKMLKDIQ